MKHVLVLGSVGMVGGQLSQAFKMVETIDCVDHSTWDEARYYVEQIAKGATTSSQDKTLKTKCFFVMPKHHRMNEHPNDDWRGQGNRRKRIKRNDR